MCTHYIYLIHIIGEKHADNKLKASQGCEYNFIGDSIVSIYWRYPKVYNSVFKNYENFGIGGDRIEHVIWRLKNGELNVL